MYWEDRIGGHVCLKLRFIMISLFLSAEFDVKGSTTKITLASVVPKLLELADDAENNALLPWWNASGDEYTWGFFFFFPYIIQSRTF